MASQNTPHSEVKPLYRTVFLNCFDSISRTSWRESTRGRSKRRNTNPVKVDGNKQQESLEIECLETKVEKIQEKLSGIEINNLQLESDYETLQLSNPWFDIEYRRLQSQLFVKAMEVRKQFLYENVKNIKAAYIIWSKQKESIPLIIHSK